MATESEPMLEKSRFPPEERFGILATRSRCCRPENPLRFHGGLLFAAWLAFLNAGCGSPTTSPPFGTPGESAPGRPAELANQIEAFCGNCHPTPRAENFPRAAWYDEVRRGYDFYFQSGRKDLQPPVQADVVEYFRARAPESLTLARPSFVPSPIRFRPQSIGRPADRSDLPAVSYLNWSRGNSQESTLRISDMRLGIVDFVSLPDATRHRRITTCRYPAVVRDCDLNANGRPDLLICDLGSFLPDDHNRGQLIWLPDGGEEPGTEVILLNNVGRIADAHAADFDGDGDEDVVVAEFGWHRTGGIHVIWNESADGRPKFRAAKIDSRSGTIHVPTADLDGDGRPDFVALISQEHETVVAFLSRSSRFEQHVIYSAPDPSYGSSGIELVDFDQDGDLDILYTNGDTFDSYVVKPYHGISWMENLGEFPFAEHRLAAMPGVHRAIPADLDGDGDLDVVAAALIPASLQTAANEHQTSGVIWLERTSSGEFISHLMESRNPVHATLDAGDFDSDGDIDLVVGGFYDKVDNEAPSAIVFWNDGIATPDRK